MALLILLICISPGISQETIPHDWQQYVKYDMDITMDVESNRFAGTQRLTYYNHSPHVIDKLYYHLYFNAFQPNSMMDVRSRTIHDPDSRVRDRIFHLSDDEIGYQNVIKLKQDGTDIEIMISETVLVAYLHTPIPPGGHAVMDMEFEAQVPIQIRRSGRDNREGIRYSMSQWYPRIAGYDAEGWATSPYIGREFHGTFGDFDVRITIDSTYTLGGTGYLQNANEIGKGYEVPGTIVTRPENDKLTWHFYAPNVIDFMWGAHTEFTHEIFHVPDGPRIHLLYVERPATRNWKLLGDYTVKAIQFLSDYLGPYPYDQFSVIQGGDGGMEYPMATLITGHRNLYSLVNVTVHELVHMWFQTALATNESRYHWIDEGFTSYMTAITMSHLFGNAEQPIRFGSHMSYLSLVNDGLEEPMNTHADLFELNRAYSMASYQKGGQLLELLGYIIGQESLKNVLQGFYRDYKFRHPNPTDFRRVAEQESGLILDWFFDQMEKTTWTIDYGINNASVKNGLLEVSLSRHGRATVPIDLLVVYEDGTKELFYIPEQRMLGEKPLEPEIYGHIPRTVLSPWRWVESEYSFSIPRHDKKLKEAIIDPSLRVPDINRLNNRIPFPVEFEFAQPLKTSWTAYNVTWRPAFWYGHESGLHAGFNLQGAYLFNNHSVSVNAMLTSGKLKDFSGNSIDIDYDIGYNRSLRNFGLSASAEFRAKRFYGIGEESITMNKFLGRLGERERVPRLLQIGGFHQYMNATRNIAQLQSEWDRKSVLALRINYEVGDPASNGVSYVLVSGAQGRKQAAGYATFTANHTHYWQGNWRTRLGVSIGSGSETMPAQWRWAVSGPTGEQLWNNTAHWAFANMDPSIIGDLNLYANDGTGLLGYALEGANSPDIAGNNYFTGTIWNTWAPFDNDPVFRLFEMELFASIGKSWNGTFFGDFPEFGADNPVLASMGAGLTFDMGSLPVFTRWKPQSRFLQDLTLSVRVPFYLNGVHDGQEWKRRFVIGISESF